MLGVRGSNLAISKHEPKTHNISDVATRQNRVAKRELDIAPNNVAICRVDMSRSLLRDFRLLNRQ